MALGTVVVTNLTSNSIFVDDLGQLANQQPPYFRLGQACYVRPGFPVTLYVDGAVQLSIIKGQLKKLADAGWISIV